MRLLYFAVFIQMLITVACTSPTAKTDADTVTPDVDAPTVDDAIETEADDFILVEADELITDADVIVEDDFETDEVSSDALLTDEDMYCPRPDKAGYPYVNEEGHLHFCRPCDTPMANDPYCAQSFWNDILQDLSTRYPDAECPAYPCVTPKIETYNYEDLPDLKMHVCDLVPYQGWMTLMVGISQQLNFMYGGKVGTLLTYGWYKDPAPAGTRTGDYETRAVEWNITTDSYRYIMPGLAAGFAYKDDTFITNFRRMTDLAKDTPNTTTFMATKKNGEWNYEPIFTTPSHYYHFSWEPAISDEYIALGIRHLTQNSSAYTDEIFYAKRGEWKWTALTKQWMLSGDIENGYLLFSPEEAGIYRCDLTKQPQSIDDCEKIDRGDEKGSMPEYDRSDPTRLVYQPYLPATRMIMVDTKTSPYTYTEIDQPFSQADAMFLTIRAFDGDLITYSEMLDNYNDSKWCFFRLSDKTRICSKANPDWNNYYDQAYGDHEGNYLVYQHMGKGRTTTLRDLKCYCEIEGPEYCPFKE